MYLARSFGGIITVFWVLMIVECMRRGDRDWIWIVVILGPIGAMAYFVACYLPQIGWLPFEGFGIRRRIRELQALRQFGLTPMQWRDLGDLYLKQQRWSEAAEAYHQALEASPSLETSRLNLAKCLGKLGRWQEALPILQPLIEKDGFYRERAILQMSDVLLQLQQQQQALAMLEPLYHPAHSAEIQYRYALCLRENRRHQEADAVLTKLISQEVLIPRSDRIWLKQARQLRKQKEIGNAGSN